MTYQISNMVTSLGAGWHLLTAAAFLSMLLPMIVFFSLQRYFIHGMLAQRAVKGSCLYLASSQRHLSLHWPF